MRTFLKKQIVKILYYLFPPHLRGYRSNDMFGIGTAISGIIQGIGNDKDRKQQKEQNEAQRLFERKQWEDTNAYNSPIEQMARLKAGGINPMAPFASGGGSNTAQNFTPSKPDPLPPRNWGESMGGAISQIADLSFKEKQKDLMETEAINNAAKTADTVSNTVYRNTVATDEGLARKYSTDATRKRTEALTDRDKFELQQAQDLKQITMDSQKAKLEEIQARTAQEKLRTMQMPEQHRTAIMEAYSRMQVAKSNMSATQLQNAMTEEALTLRKKGIEVNNSPIWKMFQDLVPKVKDHNNRAGKKAREIFNKVKDEKATTPWVQKLRNKYINR